MQLFTGLMSLSVIFLLAFTVVAQEQAYNFPEDPDVPVLKVQHLFRAEGGDTPPLVLVYGDGRIVKPIADGEDYEITIDQERLEALLNEIVVDNGFFEMESEDIKNEVVPERKRKRLRPGGFEFRVEMKLADREHVVSVGNSWVYKRLKSRKKHANAAVFQKFLNVEELSNKLSNWALLGGEQAMQTIFEAANAKAQEEYPGAPRVSKADILSLKSENGRATMYLNAKATAKTPALRVIVTKRQGEEDFDVEVELNKPRGIH